ncbi:MAG: transcriptional regulator [Treponema sp.]|nr:transcriptional regulator [Treponema sp.]
MEYNLLVSSVPHNSGEAIVKVANENGATGGTIFLGRGSASSTILQTLGLGDSAKDVVYILIEKNQTKKIVDSIVFSCQSKKKGFGILFSIDVSSFLKNGMMVSEEVKMNTRATHKLITVIANNGYADDIILTARKEGATGGTVVNARGTALPTDEKFLGMEIVPEKEMLFIVVENEKENAILQAIKNLPCLEKEGSGVAFSIPVLDFNLLGKK